LTNASADAFYGGLIGFEPARGDLKRVVDECAARKIRVIGTPSHIRISTHIFTQPHELQTFFESLDRSAQA
jgi:hypothetical protein